MIHSADEFIRWRASSDPSEYLRAANDSAPKTVPVDILLILAGDTDANVRYTVAMKNKLPPDLMFQLARDEEEVVRMRIACNKNTPFEILRLLSADTRGTSPRLPAKG